MYVTPPHPSIQYEIKLSFPFKSGGQRMLYLTSQRPTIAKPLHCLPSSLQIDLGFKIPPEWQNTFPNMFKKIMI